MRIIFKDKAGEFPNFKEICKREFKGEPITAAVFMKKTKGDLEVSIKWLDKKHINKFGKEKIIESIKKRIRDQGYDLLLEDGQESVLIV